jgi:tRNA (guanine-N7-)-methyltransferase
MPHPPAPDSPEEPSLLFHLTSAIERLDWTRIFPQPQPLEIELGSGDGSFLLEWARRHPERNFLGVERLAGRLGKLDRQGRCAGLQNLRGLRVESAYFTEYLVPPGSVAAFHIYFPDPWPKKRHAANRLIQPHFAAVLHRALTADGTVYLRTDHEAYFAQMLEVMRGAAGFRETETPAALAAVTTDFEREFAAQGIPAQRAAFGKTPAPQSSER